MQPRPAALCRLSAPRWASPDRLAADAYVRRNPRDGRWQLVAAMHHAAAPTDRNWRAEYADFENGLPRSVRLTSAPDKQFDLRLTLSQVELNTRLGPEVFRVEIPPGV